MTIKQEIAIEAVKQWEWIKDHNSSDLPTLQDVIENAIECYSEEQEKTILDLKQELDKYKLLYENEVLNSESLQRYWKRATDELETLKHKYDE